MTRPQAPARTLLRRGLALYQLLRLSTGRHVPRNPLRTALTVLGVAVGVATTVCVESVTDSVQRSFKDSLEAVAGPAHLTVTGSEVGFDEHLLDAVKRAPGVAHAAPALQGHTLLVDPPKERLLVLGYDLVGDDVFLPLGNGQRRSALEDLEFLNSTDRLLLGREVATRRSLRPGDSIDVATPTGVRPFVVHGLLEPEGMAAAFGGAVAVMDLPAAQLAFDRPGKIDRIDLQLTALSDLAAVRERLQGTLGPGVTVERPARRGESVERMLGSFTLGSRLLALIGLVLGLFLVFNTMSMAVTQRRREIAVLRAVGASRRLIQAVFVAEAGLLGLAGSALGAVFGLIGANALVGPASGTISALYVEVNAVEVAVSTRLLVLAVATGTSGCMAAAFWPAGAAAKIPPAMALRRDVALGVRRVSAGWAVLGGLALLASPLLATQGAGSAAPLPGYLSAALVFVGLLLLAPLLVLVPERLERWASGRFGVVAALAVKNLARLPVRNAVPLVAISVGVAGTVAISSFVSSFDLSTERWLEQTIGGDLFVTSAASIGGVRNAPVSPDPAAEISRVPGVSGVDLLRVLPHELDGRRVNLVAYLPEVHAGHRGRWEILEGAMPSEAEWADGAVLISENLARRGALHPGAQLSLLSPSGPRRYAVRAVVVDYSSDQGVVVFDRRRFVHDFGDRRVDTFKVYLSPGADPDLVRRAVEPLAAKYALFVLDHRQVKQQAKDLISASFAATYAMQSLVMLLSLLAVVNTLLAAQLDRKRELALFRAVGATRPQVLALVLGEAAALGVLGAAAGLCGGGILAYAVNRTIGMAVTGWALPFTVPWWTAAGMALAAALCSVAGGLYPAVRAGRLEPVEAVAE